MNDLVFRKSLDDFLSDPVVNRTMRNYGNDNVLSIMDPTEVRQSRMLAWLFNTQEKHGAGDFFIKALIKEVLNNKSSEEDQLGCAGDNSKYYTVAMVEQQSFCPSYVITEYKVSSDRNIDIVLIVPNLDLLIVIENKFSAKEGKDQTKDYRDLISEQYEKYEKIFVYMDLNGYPAKDKNCWISINYEWLAEAIGSWIEYSGMQLPSLTLYRDYIISLYGAEDTKKKDAVITEISQKHSDFIEELFERLQDEETPDHKLADSWVSDINKQWMSLSLLYWTNKEFFDDLYNANDWKVIANKLEEELKLGTIIEVNSNAVYLNNKDWMQYYNNDHKWWGVQCCIKELCKNGLEIYIVRVQVFCESLQTIKVDAPCESYKRSINEFHNKVNKLLSKDPRSIPKNAIKSLTIYQEDFGGDYKEQAINHLKEVYLSVDKSIPLLVPDPPVSA